MLPLVPTQSRTLLREAGDGSNSDRLCRLWYADTRYQARSWRELGVSKSIMSDARTVARWVNLYHALRPSVDDKPSEMLALHSQTKWGEVVMVGVLDGERYYWLEKDGDVAMLPAIVVEAGK